MMRLFQMASLLLLTEMAKAEMTTIIPIAGSDPQLLEYWIHLPLDQIRVTDVTTADGIFQRLILPEMQGIETKTGMDYESRPETPVHTSSWALPLDAVVTSFQVAPEGRRLSRSNVRLYPAQALRAEDYEDPLTKASIPFVFDDLVWTLQGLSKPGPLLDYPRAVADSNIRGFAVELAEYEPLSQTLALHEWYKVSIRFTAANGCYRHVLQDPTAAAYQDDPVQRGTIPAVIRTVINFDSWLNGSCMTVRSAAHPRPTELLIVHPPAFAAAAVALKRHKEGRGIATETVSTAQLTGSSPGPLTAADMKALVRQTYEGGLHRLRWVLLLGDVDTLPTYYDQACTATTPNGARSQGCRNSGYEVVYNAGDAYYGQLVGSQPDEIPAVGIGRMPAGLKPGPLVDAEARSMVQKTIQYELGIGPGSNFFRIATLAANLEGINQNGLQVAKPGTHAAVVEEKIVPILNRALGFYPGRFYKTISGAPVTHWTAENPLAPEVLAGGAQDDVLQPIKGGSFLVLHQGHGFPNGWEAPVLSTESLLELDGATNATGSLVLSINCHTGMFDRETVNLPPFQIPGRPYPVVDAYFGEEWIRHPQGAVAFIGASRASSTTRNQAFGPALVQLLFADNDPQAVPGSQRLGDLVNNGKAAIFSRLSPLPGLGFHPHTREFVTIYNLLGDPSLHLRRSAIPMSLEVMDVIPQTIAGMVTAQRLRLRLRSDGPLRYQDDPDRKPRVVAMDPNGAEFLARSEAGADGAFTLEIQAPWPRVINLTASGGEGIATTIALQLP